jgi:excisionase family DNA binding protein
MTQTETRYLTPKEIATILRVSVRTIQRCITTQGEDASKLKAIRVGRRGLYRIPESEFYRWLDYDNNNRHKQGRLGL